MNINLLLTCKVIATEASPIFYAVNNFALPVGQLRSPWGLRARGDLAANIESLNLTGYLHGPDKNEPKAWLSHDYLGLLKKWFPRLRAISIEYDGCYPTNAIPLRPFAVGRYTGNVMVCGATLEVSVTCPSVEEAWADISKKTSLARNMVKLQRHWQRGKSWSPDSILVAVTALWLAVEAFDRGEQGHQDVIALCGGPACDRLLHHHDNPTSLTHTALHAANGGQSSAALAYVNGFLAICSEHFDISSHGLQEVCVADLWCRAISNARSALDSYDLSHSGYAGT